MDETSEHEKNFDERGRAKKISNYLQTNHFEKVINFTDEVLII